MTRGRFTSTTTPSSLAAETCGTTTRDKGQSAFRIGNTERFGGAMVGFRSPVTSACAPEIPTAVNRYRVLTPEGPPGTRPDPRHVLRVNVRPEPTVGQRGASH